MNAFDGVKTNKLSLILLVLAGLFGSVFASDTASISNGRITLSFDTETGLLQCRHNGYQIEIVNAFAAVQTDAELVAVTDDRFDRKCRTENISDNIGPAEKLTIHCTDKKAVTDLDIEILVYDARDCFTVTLTMLNRSSGDLNVIELRPLMAGGEVAGGICLGGNPDEYAVSTDGYYMSQVGTTALLKDYPKSGSWWNITVYDRQTDKAVTAGFLANHVTESYFMAGRRSETSDRVSLESRCPLLMPGRGQKWFAKTQPWADVHDAGFGEKYPVVVRKDAAFSSDPLLVTFAASPFTTIQTYADLYHRYSRIEPKLPPAMGWCTWPYYYWAIDEEVVLKNADFVAEHFRDYGCEYIQIDGGWQVRAGTWQADKTLFPHGMKWLADRIHEKGLKIGVWISPFEIDEASEVFRDHKDWLVKNRDGSLRIFGKAHSKALSLMDILPSGEISNDYVLDVTVPEARQWLYDLFYTIRYEWGHDFIKIDWGYNTVCLAEIFNDMTKTKAQMYRTALQTVRQAIGDDCYFLNAGPQTSAGIVDASRISADSVAVWSSIVKPNGQGRGVGRRFYQNGNMWINDPDIVMVRPPLTKRQEAQVAEKRKRLDKNLARGGLPLDQAIVAASLVSFSGGQFFMGDNLCDLPSDRLDILKKCLPVYPRAAKPLDTFETVSPSMFLWEIEKDFGTWQILGLFNFTDKAQDRRVDIRKLNLHPERDYLLYDFWNNRFIGKAKESFSVSVRPTSCLVLSIHEDKGVPAVVSTNRHITQGEVDLEDVKWDPDTGTLSGVSTVMPDTDYCAAVYVPVGFTFKEAHTNTGNVNTQSPSPDMLHLYISVPKKTPVHWSLRFTEK